jgi:dCTP deaminase
MAFWNTDKLKQQCQEHALITPYRQERAKRCAYELGVGPEAYITSNQGETTHLPVNSKVTIPPGQFGLLITRETVYVPPSAIAFISMRARIKFQGLVNVSGFHVDPGFRGQLKFAVYNAGSKDIVLDQDEQVFMIWYADLDAPSPDPYPPVQVTPSVITSADVSKLKGEVASPAELKKQSDEIKHDYDKRIHSLELRQTILQGLVIALILLLVGALFKAGWFDRGNEGKRRPAVSQPQQQPIPKEQAKEGKADAEERQGEVLPQADEIKDIVGFGSYRLGVWILGGALLVSVSILVSAFVIRSRLARPHQN